jgi:hypothetical protein
VEFFADCVPRPAGVGPAPILNKALVDHFQMPIPHGDSFWLCGDAVPKRLNVVESLFSR